MGESSSWQGVHTSVLLAEVLHFLQPRDGALYVDGTLGLGGHSEAILQSCAPGGRVIGFEWDAQAAALAGQRLSRFGERFQLISSSYATLLAGLEQLGISSVDGLLLDLGVSSLQLDRAVRGFSFQQNGPLDMRMDSRGTRTAADLINSLPEEELADLFFHYGEERQARRIATRIVYEREREKIETTGQLADLIWKAVPRKYHPARIHVATRVFQALRIAVNRELDNLIRILEDAPSVLASGARFCVITFHSLEDRMVKRAFADNSSYQVLTRQPLQATNEELQHNLRARSARLRVAQRC